MTVINWQSENERPGVELCEISKARAKKYLRERGGTVAVAYLKNNRATRKYDVLRVERIRSVDHEFFTNTAAPTWKPRWEGDKT